MALGLGTRHKSSCAGTTQQGGCTASGVYSPFSSLVPGGISLRRRVSNVRISVAHCSNVVLEMLPTGSKRMRKWERELKAVYSIGRARASPTQLGLATVKSGNK